MNASFYVTGICQRFAGPELDSTVSSPSSRAMTMLVSSKNLPLAGIAPLAAFFNRLRHLPRRNGVERGCELAQRRAVLALRRRTG